MCHPFVVNSNQRVFYLKLHQHITTRSSYGPHDRNTADWCDSRNDTRVHSSLNDHKRRWHKTCDWSCRRRGHLCVTKCGFGSAWHGTNSISAASGRCRRRTRASCTFDRAGVSPGLFRTRAVVHAQRFEWAGYESNAQPRTPSLPIQTFGRASAHKQQRAVYQPLNGTPLVAHPE